MSAARTKPEGKVRLKPGDQPQTVIIWDNLDGLENVIVDLSSELPGTVQAIIFWKAEKRRWPTFETVGKGRRVELRASYVHVKAWLDHDVTTEAEVRVSLAFEEPSVDQK